MGDTFGGEWHRPHGTRSGKDRQRGYSKGDLEYLAHYDNQPATSYSGCLLIAMTILAALAAALGVVLG